MKGLPLGNSDFRKLREYDDYFVDKSLLIRDIIEAREEILIFPRPRRFGKTLNLSMLRYFFAIESAHNGARELFAGLAITHEPHFEAHFASLPVISLSLRDISQFTFEQALERFQMLLAQLYKEHGYLQSFLQNSPADYQYYQDIIFCRATAIQMGQALEQLIGFLHAYHQRRVMVLIDEYDTPIMTAYERNYLDHMLQFMRAFLGSSFKDNSKLHKAVITGIMRIAQQSIFSEFNNPVVYDMLVPEFSQYFGFSEAEVESLCDYYQLSERMPVIREWYNGYQMGPHSIYNPWSVLNFVKRKHDVPAMYWANTGSPAIIGQILRQGPQELFDALQGLITGKPIYSILSPHLILQHLDNNPTTAYSFLWAAGYLKARLHDTIDETSIYELLIPNKEVARIYKDQILVWFGRSPHFNSLTHALERNDMHYFAVGLQAYVADSMSYFDIGGKYPERVYQAFLLGLFTQLAHRYHVRSNRESGFGRYDLALLPRDTSRRGFVIELKSKPYAGPGPIEAMLDRALAQIDQRDYTQEMRRMGIGQITRIAIVFEGKQLWMKHLDD